MVSSDRPFSPRLRWLLLAALLAYAGLLGWNVGAYAGGADSSGYLNHARMLAGGTVRTPTRDLPGAPAVEISAFAYVPLGFSPASAGNPREMVAIYPLGLPLLLALAGTLLGWTLAAPVTVVAHALAGLGVTYALGRAAGLHRRLALLGAALLAVSPQYIFNAVQLLSDLPALVWTTAAILCAWKARTRPGWSWAAGLVFALAVLIRPTNALAAVPVLIALGATWSRWWRMGLAGLPLALGLLWYNKAAYGHPLRFGYGEIGEAFGVGYVWPTLLHYALWLPVSLAVVGVLVLALPWAQSVERPWKAVLLSWCMLLGVFYALYPFTHQDWWALRFVLPAFPAALVGALLVAQSWLAARSAAVQRKIVIATAVAGIAWGLVWCVPLRSWKIGRDEQVYVHAATWARNHLPAGTVVFGAQTTGAMHYYTESVVVHWPFAHEPDARKIVAAARGDGRQIYAFLFPEEEAMLSERPLPGRWVKEGWIRHVSVWKLVDAP
ncbi:MAG TPA: phospholipid carrier-dependent glycosyltransferase [Opitutaceae bacterium]